MDITVSPTQLYNEIIEVISAGLVPIVKSSPGMSKSAIISLVAKDCNLKLIDLRLSQCTPEDLQGFPMRTGNKASFVPFDMFPIAGEPIPDGYDGYLLLLDEITSASKPVQAAAYKLVLDKYVGSFPLHENCAIVCAGNKATDHAVVVKMSTALQSRLIHYELELSAQDWLTWAYAEDLDHRVTGFINFMPDKLMSFDPDNTDETFSCPRTLEFLSKLTKGKEVTNKMLPRIAGTIGSGVAIEFICFAQEFDKLPSFSDICTKPDSVSVPDEPSTKYATISMLIQNHTDTSIKEVLQYVERFDPEMQIVFSKGVNAKNPRLRTTNTAFQSFMLSLVQSIQ